jgi:hypothetical protein
MSNQEQEDDSIVSITTTVPDVASVQHVHRMYLIKILSFKLCLKGSKEITSTICIIR